MTIRLEEVVRSDVEGGLSGPANPIPSQSIDCGCGQLPCPKLARFATRRLFVVLLSCVGLLQAAAYAYFYVVGPTIARRFRFDPYVMDWVLALSELTPFFLGLIVAYWGDKIHRAAWVGGSVLLQSVSYFILIIPHLTHHTRVVEETHNVTHMSLYSDDSRELCSATTSRIITEENEPCFFTLGVLIAVQIMTGIANISYYALGISYLDDNTKKRHVAAFIGVIIAVKIIGVLLGYILAWGCLRIDAETLNPVGSYREQIGAWWLGFPILSVLLIVPGLLMSWFPRMLPSEVVEQAAASLLNSAGRYNRVTRRYNSLKVGSPNFCATLGRLFTNKILLCNILASVLYATAIVNFMTYENIILESRFHVPRPTGMLLGFGDPWSSRLISNLLKPVLIGLIVIISGLVIAKGKPNARCIVLYNLIAVILSAAIIFSLTATSCERKDIIGTDSKGSIFLPRYCNKDCGCSNNADFRPVCDNNDMFTFYSPCHAGCTSSDTRNGVTTYDGCSCVEEMTGKGNTEAKEGPCGSSVCQAGWLIFEFGTMLAYGLVASTFIGDLLIALRSVYAQDKAVGIAFWMTWSAVIVNVPGKILYQAIAKLTCRFWGNERSVCHLHDGLKLGDYLCYVTGSLLILCCLIKILMWFFCKNLKFYVQPEEQRQRGAEMQELIDQSAARRQQNEESTNTNNNQETQVEVNNPQPQPVTTTTVQEESPQKEEEVTQNRGAPLKYGPLGPGDRRTDPKPSPDQTIQLRKPKIRNMDSEDELSSSDEDVTKDSSPRVAYRPLDLDSDVESDLSSVEPRSRKRIISKDYDRPYAGSSDQGSSTRSSLPKREFPNPDNYEDPRLSRNPRLRNQNGFLDGSSKTNSFEFSKSRHDNLPNKGDFNEVGIPVVDPEGLHGPAAPDSRFLKDVKSLINRYEKNTHQEGDEDVASVKSSEESGNRTDSKMVSGIPLVAMVPKRPSSRGQSSSGFGSSQEDRVPDARSDSRGSNNSKGSHKGSKGTLHTDL